MSVKIFIIVFLLIIIGAAATVGLLYNYNCLKCKSKCNMFKGCECSDCWRNGECNRETGECECPDCAEGCDESGKCYCPNDCSGHGTCLEDGTCKCDGRRKGYDCSHSCDKCVSSSSCDDEGKCRCPNDCSNHGECMPNGACWCDDDYWGPFCDRKIPQLATVLNALAPQNKTLYDKYTKVFKSVIEIAKYYCHDYGMMILKIIQIVNNQLAKSHGSTPGSVWNKLAGLVGTVDRNVHAIIQTITDELIADCQGAPHLPTLVRPKDIPPFFEKYSSRDAQCIDGTPCAEAPREVLSAVAAQGATHSFLQELVKTIEQKCPAWKTDPAKVILAIIVAMDKYKQDLGFLDEDDDWLAEAGQYIEALHTIEQNVLAVCETSN